MHAYTNTRMWIGWLHWFPPPMSVAQSQLLFRIKMSNEEREKKYFYYVACIILVVRWLCFAYSLALYRWALSRALLTLSFAQCFSCKYFEIFIANCDNIMREASTQFQCIHMNGKYDYSYICRSSCWGVYFSVTTKPNTLHNVLFHTRWHISFAGWHTHTHTVCLVHTYQPVIIFRKHYFIWQRCSNKMT